MSIEWDPRELLGYTELGLHHLRVIGYLSGGLGLMAR